MNGLCKSVSVYEEGRKEEGNRLDGINRSFAQYTTYCERWQDKGKENGKEEFRRETQDIFSKCNGFVSLTNMRVICPERLVSLKEKSPLLTLMPFQTFQTLFFCESQKM